MTVIPGGPLVSMSCNVANSLIKNFDLKHFKSNHQQGNDVETALARKVSKDKGNDTGKQIILTRPFKLGNSALFKETDLAWQV